MDMSSYRFITILLTMLQCCTLYHHDPFISESVYLLIPFTYLAHVLHSLPSGNPEFLCIYESVSVLFFAHLFCFLDSTHT